MKKQDEQRSTTENDYVIAQYQQLVLLRLTSQRTGNVPIQPGQKAFFDNVSLDHGKRVVSISMFGLNVGNYQGTDIMGYGVANSFVLNIVNLKGETVLWNYPCVDLLDFSNVGGVSDTRGKMRLFDIDIDFKKSYALYIFPSPLPANSGLLFNFFSAD